MSQGTDTASQALGVAAAAATAIPVAGVFAGAALGLASGLTKLFGNIDGPRKRKARRRAAAYEARMNAAKAMGQQQGAAQQGGPSMNTGDFGADQSAEYNPPPSYEPQATVAPTVGPANPYMDIINGR